MSNSKHTQIPTDDHDNHDVEQTFGDSIDESGNFDANADGSVKEEEMVEHPLELEQPPNGGYYHQDSSSSNSQLPSGQEFQSNNVVLSVTESSSGNRQKSASSPRRSRRHRRHRRRRWTCRDRLRWLRHALLFVLALSFLAAIIVVSVMVGAGIWIQSIPFLKYHKDGNSTTNESLIQDNTTTKMERFNQLINIVVYQEGWVSPSLLESHNGPQWDACVWLSEFDRRHLDFATPTIHPELKERFAVAVLYFALNGRSWVYDMDWLSSAHVCEWGMTAWNVRNKESTSFRIGIDCGPCTDGSSLSNSPGCYDNDASSLVKRVVLPRMGLEGTLPHELALLHDLEELRLSHNYIGGEFPLAARNLEKLKMLDLTSNEIDGSLPLWMGDMQSLTVLLLANNTLTGTLPESIQRMSNLTQISLSGNSLSSSGATNPLLLLSKLKNLQLLLASNMGLTGNLSASETDPLVTHVWPMLAVLDLSKNHLVGGLPDWLFSHDSLAVLDVGNNSLTGTIPNVSKMSTLQYFSASGNQFSGLFPLSLMTNALQLYHLDVSFNDLTGPFPTGFPPAKLQYVDLSFNNFDAGPVPRDFFVETSYTNEVMPTLKHLSLQQTNRKGSIEEMLSFARDDVTKCWWTQLETLDLGDNAMTGEIPRALTAAVRLRNVILFRNHFTGDFAPVMTQFRYLESLVVHENSWSVGIEVAPLCVPSLEEFTMDNCVMHQSETEKDSVGDLGGISNASNASMSYCPCCQCCVATASNASLPCSQTTTHYTWNLDQVWNSAYVRQKFGLSDVELSATPPEKTMSKITHDSEIGNG